MPGLTVEIEPHELDAALDRLETGDFTIEEHSAAVLTKGIASRSRSTTSLWQACLAREASRRF